jgi:hypothetical protein
MSIWMYQIHYYYAIRQESIVPGPEQGLFHGNNQQASGKKILLKTMMGGRRHLPQLI